MTGNESIDLGLKNIYSSWFVYHKGKKPSHDIDHFQYNLYEELYNLQKVLNNNTYKHGNYQKFTVTDNKTREISVASVRDRVVHRLLYDHLNRTFDKTFVFDAWSCRRGKGLIGCIKRTQKFIRKYPDGFVWRADIRKFFDNVNHHILYEILKRKIRDARALSLLEKIIDSFEIKTGVGIPIGNLTSQIFSNIYLNELDRFIKHQLKCKAYLRYGDDFVIFNRNRDSLLQIRAQIINFIENKLKLNLHAKNNLVIKTKHGLKFLGVVLYPNSRKLNKRSRIRIKYRINPRNSGSYWGIISKHETSKKLKEFNWLLLNKQH